MAQSPLWAMGLEGPPNPFGSEKEGSGRPTKTYCILDTIYGYQKVEMVTILSSKLQII